MPLPTPPTPPTPSRANATTTTTASNNVCDTDSLPRPAAVPSRSATSRGLLHDPTARLLYMHDHAASAVDRLRHRSSRDSNSHTTETSIEVPLRSLPSHSPHLPQASFSSDVSSASPTSTRHPLPSPRAASIDAEAVSAGASTSTDSPSDHPSLPPNLGSEHVLGATRTHSSSFSSHPHHSAPRATENEPLSSPELIAGAFVTNMATKKTPFLRHEHDVREAPYGSVSLTPSRNASPASSEHSSDAHILRRVSDGSRSKRSNITKQASRLSEDLDGAMLVSGLDGRFGVAEAPPLSGVLSNDKADSEEGPLLEDRDVDSDAEDVENSPHEAVRASVPPTDDTTLSINTPRMWTLSVLFSILGSSTNLFFSLRYPSVAITPVIALLLVHPLGLLWDYFLKRPYDVDEQFIEGIRTPSLNDTDDPMTRPRKTKLNSWRIWLSQGRWNEKEHTCVYVSSNVAFGFAFATDVIVEQTHFYNQEAPIMYQLLLTISTQILGYGFAGLSRRILVRPSGMVWPGTLMSAAMFSTLHRQENKPANGWKITRWRFFFIVWSVGFAFYFLPGLLFPALSNFNVITWFAPKNVVIANLFGVSSGLGLFPVTFDWAQITYIGSPLLIPFWAAMNVIGGLAVVMWIIAPILYYTNVVYSSYMPILSTAVFDNKGEMYNVSRILTSEFIFDKEAYRNYSRVFLPITYMLSYGVQFAALAALLTHTACWHGQEIWSAWKKALAEAREESRGSYQSLSDGSNEQGRPSPTNLGQTRSNDEGLLTKEDIHCRLMRRYPDVPASWYLITFLSMAAIGVFVVEYYPVHLPWYGLALALAIGAIFFIPNGIIMAITNQHSSIYLICQLICGAVFPGRPIANMVFVSYGYISSAQGIKFASDLKLGHYMKIPPRMMFTVQVVATLVSSVTQIGVLNWMFANVKSLCTPEAVSGFSCPIARVHFNGSILWGVVGVGEFFGPNALYRALVWCFPLGAILPIPLWLYSRRKKDSVLRKVNLPVIFGAMSWIPPATGLNFSVWAVVCYIFNYRIKRRAGAWWAKYTMTLSAALDSGLAFGIVVVFFGFLYPGWTKGFSWWGTEVYKQGCDWQACPYRTLDEGERFGPDTW